MGSNMVEFQGIGKTLSVGSHEFIIRGITQSTLNDTDFNLNVYSTDIITIEGHAGGTDITNTLIFDRGFEFLRSSNVAVGQHHVIWQQYGQTYGQGYNSFGQFSSPVTGFLQNTFMFDAEWTLLDSGETHIIALDPQGNVWGWGGNESQQVANPSSPSIAYPLSIYSDSNTVAISAGAASHSSFYLTQSGDLYTAGRNNMGQLGQDTTNSSSYFSLVPMDAPITHATLGSDHGLAISNGHLYGWGSNGYGQLGSGMETSSSYVPILINDTQVWVSCFAGSFHSFAINNNGELFAWGKNNKGQLGLGHKETVYQPTLVNFSMTIKDIRMGHDFTLILDINGDLHSVGSNELGQLGRTTPSAHSTNLNFVLSNVESIEAGPYSSWVSDQNGNLSHWGKTIQGVQFLPTPFNVTTQRNDR
jgi:alpha-tubulin suppressor-like RCC1 family protein